MQYIPGSSVTLSASLHALQHHPIPDDTDVQTRIPQICVDYLSHEWLEEDVWKSWRSMTRHKNEVANGVRLENASWRTWWKQRNKLRTISPETLNWLKDSDVTWLYGPLHTAADPVPPPKVSTTEERFNLVKASGKKPILKHRTISDMFGVPLADATPTFIPHSASPVFENANVEPDENDPVPDRPHLHHTKSDTNILRATSKRTSPPRASDLLMGGSGDSSSSNTTHNLSREHSHSSSRSGTPVSEGLRGSGGSGGALSSLPKKHISFNTFVEQRISIEDPIKVSPETISDSPTGEIESEEDDSPSSALEIHPGGPGVHIRLPLQRSNSTSTTRSNSHISDHVTIVPIPPAMLKTPEIFGEPSPALVFAPPQHTSFAYTPSPESSESSSTEDNGSVDFGFVPPPVWARNPSVQPSPASQVVGTGPLGAAGPAGPFNAYQPYQHQVSYTSKQQYARAIASHHQAGMNDGRSHWVSQQEVEDEDDEDDEGRDSESSEAVDDDDDDEEEDRAAAYSRSRGSAPLPVKPVRGASDTSERPFDYFTGPDFGVGEEYSTGADKAVRDDDEDDESTATNKSTSTGSSSTVVGSAPISSKPTPSRTNSTASSRQPVRSILKNAASSSPERSYRPSVSHSAPIVIPHPGGGPATSNDALLAAPAQPGFVHPAASTLSDSPQQQFMGGPSHHPDSHAGGPLAATHLYAVGRSASPSFSQSPPPGQLPFTGRGRSAARTSSSVSDRSRSSSKNGAGSLHNSPIGSVSPSGYGSPSGSRANSVIGASNRRHSGSNGSTVSPVGRAAVMGAGGRAVGGVREGRERERKIIERPNSLSPPILGSSYRPSGLGSPPTTAPVPSPPVVTSQPVASPSSSPITPTSSSTQAFRMPPTSPSRSLPPSSPTDANGRKTSPIGSFKNKVVPPNGVRPTVVISRDPASAVIGGGPVTSNSEGASGELEDEMKARKRDDYWADKPNSPPMGNAAMPTSPPSQSAKLNGAVNAQPREIQRGRTAGDHQQSEASYTLSNPTPSNSPVFGIKSLASGSAGPKIPIPPPPAVSSPGSGSGTPTPKESTAPRIYSPSKAPASNATVTTSSASAMASPGRQNSLDAVGPDGESGIVGKAVGIVGSARGLLGAIWGGGGGTGGAGPAGGGPASSAV